MYIMNLIKYVFAIIFLTIIDLIWIYYNKSLYSTLVKNIQGSNMNIRILGALIAYPLMYIGLIFIVFKLIEQDTNKNKVFLSLRYGALFGLIIYGVFNATNYAMFSSYNLMTGIIDTLWGTFAYFITTFVTLLLF